jgi:hypothetical protein
MPYLHWAASGDTLDCKNALIKELSTVEFHRRDYKRPTPEQIEAFEDVSIDMKLMRAFFTLAVTAVFTFRKPLINTITVPCSTLMRALKTKLSTNMQ